MLHKKNLFLRVEVTLNRYRSIQGHLGNSCQKNVIPESHIVLLSCHRVYCVAGSNNCCFCGNNWKICTMGQFTVLH